MRSIPVLWSLFGAALILALTWYGTSSRSPRQRRRSRAHGLFGAQLPNVLGKTLTAIVVKY